MTNSSRLCVYSQLSDANAGERGKSTVICRAQWNTVAVSQSFDQRPPFKYGPRIIHPYPNPFHIIQADAIAVSIIELRGEGGRVVGHRCRVLQRAAVFQVGCDSGRSKRVNADQTSGFQRLGAPAFHGVGVGVGVGVGIGMWLGGSAQLPGAALNRTKQRRFQIAFDAGLHSPLSNRLGLVMP